jgi:hypothetical protein
MVGWYDPPRPVAMTLRVAISTVFDRFAERGEVLATAIRPV